MCIGSVHDPQLLERESHLKECRSFFFYLKAAEDFRHPAGETQDPAAVRPQLPPSAGHVRSGGGPLPARVQPAQGGGEDL